MQEPNFKKKKLSSNVENISKGEMTIDTSGDEDLMKEEEYSWDELSKLKEDLASKVVGFMMDMERTIKEPLVIDNLGSREDEFVKTTEIFFRDMDNFSKKVKANRLLHEDKFGKVKDLDELNLYNRCSMGYHTLFTELAALVTPTLGKIMVIISEIESDSKEAQDLIKENVSEEGKEDAGQ